MKFSLGIPLNPLNAESTPELFLHGCRRLNRHRGLPHKTDILFEQSTGIQP